MKFLWTKRVVKRANRFQPLQLSNVRFPIIAHNYVPIMLKSFCGLVVHKYRICRCLCHTSLTVNIMDKISVRSVEGDDRMRISLLYQAKTLQSPKQVNADRPKDEELAKTFERFGTNFTKKVFSKKKLKEFTEPNLTTMTLKRPSGEVVGQNTLNNEAWSSGSVLGIQFEDTLLEYKVVVNPPMIRQLKLPECILAGYSVTPEVDGEFIDLDKCLFKWYRVTIRDTNSAVGEEQHSKKKQKTSNVSEDVVCVGEGPCYVVQNSDIGSKLKLVCIPCNGTVSWKEEEVISKSAVMVGPIDPPFEKRHLETQSYKGDDRQVFH